MALKLMSVETVPVTKGLAKKFRDMKPLNNERGLKVTRAKHHVRLLADGDFFTPLWGSCLCNGVTYRGNGNHTSHVLSACMQAHNGGLDDRSKRFANEFLLTRGGEWQGEKPEDLPAVNDGQLQAVYEQFEADAEEDLVKLFQRYDSPESARSRIDQLCIYIGEQVELRELSSKKVRYALDGVLKAAHLNPSGFQLSESFAKSIFQGANKGESLRFAQVVRAVRWVVETVPDDALYKNTVGAQVCAEIYADYGESRGEKIIDEMMRQIEEETDPAAAWEAALTKKRNRPTAESLLKRGRTIVKDIAKKL